MRVKSIWKAVRIFCCAFLLVTVSCTAKNATRLKYTSAVRAILEDSKGNIWFGSYSEGVCLLQNGTLRYFTTKEGLSDNQVRTIYEAQNGTIWFECGKGLSTYDGKRITTYTKRNYRFPHAWVLNKTDLWFKADESEGYNTLEKQPGVYHYNGHQLFYRYFPVTQKPGDGFKYYISTPFVNGKNGTVWFGAYGAVIGFNGAAFTLLDNDYLGLNAATGLLHVRSLFEDRNGNLWIGSNGMGVIKYDGKKAVHFTAQQQLRKKDTKGNSLEKVFSVGEDTSGSIWFGTAGSGVWRYDGTSVKNFTATDGLTSNHIWTIYKSKQGALWFGGDNGVYRFNGTAFERKF